MTTQIAPLTLTANDMEATYYGIAVCYSGEDGDMIALGHHDKRRTIAALNKHARVYCGLRNITDDHRTRAASISRSLSARWGLATKPDPEDGDDPDWAWILKPATAETPGAIPYMFLIG